MLLQADIVTSLISMLLQSDIVAHLLSMLLQICFQCCCKVIFLQNALWFAIFLSLSPPKTPIFRSPGFLLSLY